MCLHAFYLLNMRLQSESFHLLICLRGVCCYLWENPSCDLIQPTNHLLRVISPSCLNCKQNSLAYWAHCFSWGLTRCHSSNPVTTQSAHGRLVDVITTPLFVPHPPRRMCKLWIGLRTPWDHRQASVSLAVNDPNTVAALFPSVCITQCGSMCHTVM